MATIELKNIVKAFGATIAINHVSLDVNDGEFLVLLGPSGCGKTTTLRSIAGLETVDEGDIFIDGRRVNDVRPAERDMAFCFQHYALYPHLTAYANISFPLRTQNTPSAEIEKRVNEVGRILDIADIFNKKPKQLSSGDQQRVALARAMVRQPKVYLMDEPLSNLDAKLREDMRVQLRRLQLENKITTVYVTHDQIEAMAMADRIAIMNKGFLLQVGSPDDVYAYPANLFVANFIGSPSMNFIPCEYSAQESGTVISLNGDKAVYKLPPPLAQKARSLKEGTPLVIGVRPEDVKVHASPQEGGIELELALVESLGSENILHLSKGNVHIKARTSPDFAIPDVNRVWTSFDVEGVRLFDRATENAISQEGSYGRS